MMKEIEIRNAQTSDAPEVWQLVQSITALDPNSCYAYLLWCTYFQKYTLVAERVDSSGTGQQIVGFVSSFLVPERPDTLFVWQIGVAAAEQGNGLGQRLLSELVARTVTLHGRIQAVEATCTPSNAPSRRLFEGMARRCGATVEYRKLFPESYFPQTPHEEEQLIRIEPVQI
ncbi:MAG: diaminobutyrate acetyltransferase [Bdellovibrionales bacterium]|nr:diaminobutyrate acetyltransferase [Bdellovibrionales bacterium]